MVDPTNVTIYDCIQEELEKFLLFCVAVANKNVNTIAKGIEKLLQHGRKTCKVTPFEIVRHLADTQNFLELLRSFGFGCFNKKAEYLLATVKCGLDISTCAVEDLKAIYGVGMKTARYFIFLRAGNPYQFSKRERSVAK
jgi:endonuclease III